jgi:hypothetical protein
MLSPHMVHYALSDAVLEIRQRILTAAFQQHPVNIGQKGAEPVCRLQVCHPISDIYQPSGPAGISAADSARGGERHNDETTDL